MKKVGSILNRFFLNKIGLGIVRYRTLEQIKREKWLTPFTIDKHAIRFLYIYNILQKIKNVQGCIVECGVATGRTLLMVSYILKYENQKRQIIGYDTFEGLPPASEKDNEYAKGREGTMLVSQKEALNYLLKSNIGDDFIDKIILIKGDVRDTLKDFTYGPISLLHLDKAALEILYDKVVTGGVIMFDDFEDSKWEGATKAIHEFFGDLVKQFVYDPSIGKYYYIKRD